MNLPSEHASGQPLPRRTGGLGGALRRWRDGERGMQEIAATIFTLPLIFLLMVLLIEVGFNIRTRAQVDAVVQDAARGVSLDGGNYNPATQSLCLTRGCGKTWSGEMTRRLRLICDNGPAADRCRVITATCTPMIATYVGQPVVCNAEVDYFTTITAMRQPGPSLGFNRFFEQNIRSRAESVSIFN